MKKFVTGNGLILFIWKVSTGAWYPSVLLPGDESPNIIKGMQHCEILSFLILFVYYLNVNVVIAHDPDIIR